MIRRVLAAVLFAWLPTTAAFAAPPPTGAVSCTVFSDINMGQPKGILFRPFINATPRTVKIAATNVGSSCDNSGVTGGKAAITGVAMKLTARMPNGTCAELTSPSPLFENARLLLKWRGLNPAGNFMTVSTSHARIASVSYDTGTHALNLTTEPITGPAFSGKTVTLHLTFDDYVEVFEAGCSSMGGFLAEGFGNNDPATIDVQ